MSATSPGPDALLRIASGFMTAKVLLTASSLGLFSELAERPLTGDELRARLALHPRSAHDFLDTLVALGLLERTDGTYANTPATARYLVRGEPTYLGGFLEMTDARMYGLWGRLEAALRTGEPQNEIKSGDEDIYATLYADPERLAAFQQAMTGLSMGSVLALVDAIDWSPYRTVADIGCAEGFLLTRLLRRHAHLRGIGFDLPAAAPGFQQRLTQSGLTDRITFRAGDFFTEPLPQADVLIFGHILSNWDLPTCRTLLRKAHEALPDGGLVVIYETLLDDDRRENVDGLLMSLTMLLETPGGFEYTGADCRGWLADAGFRESHVRHLAGPESMVIARK